MIRATGSRASEKSAVPQQGIRGGSGGKREPSVRMKLLLPRAPRVRTEEGFYVRAGTAEAKAKFSFELKDEERCFGSCAVIEARPPLGLNDSYGPRLWPFAEAQ
ncbi:hypothetical protein NL676_027805 [Syzygium grande]|nr:hypothetical protein NL676_027805 [Syzygium grande]